MDRTKNPVPFELWRRRQRGKAEARLWGAGGDGEREGGRWRRKAKKPVAAGSRGNGRMACWQNIIVNNNINSCRAGPGREVLGRPVVRGGGSRKHVLNANTIVTVFLGCGGEKAGCSDYSSFALARGGGGGGGAFC